LILRDSLREWRCKTGNLLAFDWRAWLVSSAQDLLHILLITLGAFALWKLGSALGRRGIAVAIGLVPGDIVAERRFRTLTSVLQGAWTALILAVAGMMILQQLGFNIAPILASAGIASLAVGLAAQSLLRDILGGLLIILENPFTVGDVIQIGEHSGTVEQIGLRRTVIRDVEGTAISIPNGEIRVLQNKTRGWSQVYLVAEVSYETDVDRAIAVLKTLGEDLQADTTFGPLLMEAPTVLGVNELGPYSVKIPVAIKTKPGQQWVVGCELRARLLKRFAQEEIEIPYPHQVQLIRQADK
jgi:small-conductance mechanosensitive channel